MCSSVFVCIKEYKQYTRYNHSIRNVHGRSAKENQVVDSAIGKAVDDVEGTEDIKVMTPMSLEIFLWMMRRSLSQEH